MDVSQSFHPAKHEDLEDYVIECHQRMYGAYFAGRDAVPDSQIVEIKYEDLVADPVEQLRQIYQRLELGDFANLEAKLEAWVKDQHQSYKTNQHSMPGELEQKLREKWSEYFDRYGY